MQRVLFLWRSPRARGICATLRTSPRRSPVRWIFTSRGAWERAPWRSSRASACRARTGRRAKTSLMPPRKSNACSRPQESWRYEHAGGPAGHCDTLLELKPRSFSRLVASPTSYSHCWLAGVPASTHEPQVVRHTMLDDGRSRQEAHLSGCVPRQDVDLPHHVAVRAETTLPAGIHPAAWFVPLPAIWTGLGRVVLIDQLDGDPFRFRLKGDVLADLAVVPLRGLLVMLLPMIDAIGNVSHITDHDPLHLPFNRNRNNGPADLVLHVAHDLLMLCAHPAPGFFQAPVPTTPLLLPAERLTQFCQPFRVALLLMPPLPTGDDDGLLLIAHNRRMDLTEIDRDDVCSWWRFRLLTVLDNQVPGVAVSTLVVNQADFQDASYVP